MNLSSEPVIQRTVGLQRVGIVPSTNEMRACEMLDQRFWRSQTD